MSKAEGRKLLREVADVIRYRAQHDGLAKDGVEFLLNLAAVVERMDPAPLRS